MVPSLCMNKALMKLHGPFGPMLGHNGKTGIGMVLASPMAAFESVPTSVCSC
jgi:hypothetical protein